MPTASARQATTRPTDRADRSNIEEVVPATSRQRSVTPMVCGLIHLQTSASTPNSP